MSSDSASSEPLICAFFRMTSANTSSVRCTDHGSCISRSFLVAPIPERWLPDSSVQYTEFSVKRHTITSIAVMTSSAALFIVFENIFLISYRIIFYYQPFCDFFHCAAAIRQNFCAVYSMQIFCQVSSRTAENFFIKESCKPHLKKRVRFGPPLGLSISGSSSIVSPK